MLNHIINSGGVTGGVTKSKFFNREKAVSLQQQQQPAGIDRSAGSTNALGSTNAVDSQYSFVLNNVNEVELDREYNMGDLANTIKKKKKSTSTHHDENLVTSLARLGISAMSVPPFETFVNQDDSNSNVVMYSTLTGLSLTGGEKCKTGECAVPTFLKVRAFVDGDEKKKTTFVREIPGTRIPLPMRTGICCFNCDHTFEEFRPLIVPLKYYPSCVESADDFSPMGKEKEYPIVIRRGISTKERERLEVLERRLWKLRELVRGEIRLAREEERTVEIIERRINLLLSGVATEIHQQELGAKELHQRATELHRQESRAKELHRQELRKIIESELSNPEATPRSRLIVKEIFEGEDVVCSFNCMVSIANQNYRNYKYKNCPGLIKKLYRRLLNIPLDKYLKLDTINPAPDKRLLTKFGGPFSIEKYRESFNALKFVDTKQSYKGTTVPQFNEGVMYLNNKLFQMIE